MFKASIAKAAAEICGLRAIDASRGVNPRTSWWTTSGQGGRLTEDGVLPQRTPEVIARYRQARRMAASAVTEAKQQLWEEFGGAMEKDSGQQQGVSGKPSGMSVGGNGGPSKLCKAWVGHC